MKRRLSAILCALLIVTSFQIQVAIGEPEVPPADVMVNETVPPSVEEGAPDAPEDGAEVPSQPEPDAAGSAKASPSPEAPGQGAEEAESPDPDSAPSVPPPDADVIHGVFHSGADPREGVLRAQYDADAHRFPTAYAYNPGFGWLVSGSYSGPYLSFKVGAVNGTAPYAIAYTLSKSSTVLYSETLAENSEVTLLGSFTSGNYYVDVIATDAAGLTSTARIAMYAHISGASISLNVTETTPPIKPVETIAVSKSAIELFPLESLGLSASVSPGNATIKSVDWTSEDEGVATVSPDGVVTAVGLGETLIYAIATDGSGVVGSCACKVVDVKELGGAVAALDGESAFIYDGTEQRPSSVAVRYNDALLIQDVDYVIGGYRDNTNAGTAQLIVAGIGSYRGELEIPFTILPRRLDSSQARMNDTAEYTGEPITPKVTCFLGETQLVEGVDYAVTYQNNVAIGTATAIIQGIGNFNGSWDWDFDINPISLSSAIVEIGQREYTGEPIEPEFDVVLNGVTLRPGVDYIHSFLNNVECGVAELEIEGIGVYVGWFSRSFSIMPILSVDCPGEITVFQGMTYPISTLMYGLGVEGNYVARANEDDESIVSVNLKNTSIYSDTFDVRGTGVGATYVRFCVWQRATGTLGKEIVVKVNVLEAARSLTLNHSYLTVGVGQKISTARATVDPPSIGCTWTSSNPSVAKVDSKTGAITGVGVGYAYINVQTEDGGSQSKRITVRVVPKGKGVTGVKMSKASATIYVRKTLSLKASLSPSGASDKGITWTSSAPGIAKVSSKGVVTAVSPGSAVITATSSSGIQATCQIAVKTKYVSGISLNAKTKSVAIGKTYILKASVSPKDATNAKVDWTSGNPSVATVSSTGVVKAVGVGSCVITATARDGSGKKASCKITVTPIKATKVTIKSGGKAVSSMSLSAKEIGKTVALTAAISPSNATYKAVKWSSSNAKVASVDGNGVVTILGKGKATITATATDGSKKTGKCSISIR